MSGEPFFDNLNRKRMLNVITIPIGDTNSMCRKYRYRLCLTIYSGILFLLLFALVHHHEPQKYSELSQYSSASFVS